MHNFSQIAIKLLSEYKNLIKKQFNSAESAKKLAQVGLDKRIPRRECELYRLLVKVLKKTTQEESNAPSRLRYSGLDHFLEHMSSALESYRIDNGQVIHAAQAASRAMIEAIQLIPLPEARLTDAIAAKLNACARVIAKYGVDEQKKIFMNSIKTHLPRQVDFFLPILNKFREYLAETICFDEPTVHIGMDISAEKIENIAC